MSATVLLVVINTPVRVKFCPLCLQFFWKRTACGLVHVSARRRLFAAIGATSMQTTPDTSRWLTHILDRGVRKRKLLSIVTFRICQTSFVLSSVCHSIQSGRIVDSRKFNSSCAVRCAMAYKHLLWLVDIRFQKCKFILETSGRLNSVLRKRELWIGLFAQVTSHNSSRIPRSKIMSSSSNWPNQKSRIWETSH